MGSEMGIGDRAVRKATGKTWEEWLGILDEWGAAQKGHRATAKHLERDRGLSGWWAQAVTVRHELERGIRTVGQRGATFSVSVSRTIRTTPEKAFDALTKPEELSVWFTRDAVVDLRVGGRYRNADRDEGEFLRIERPHRLRFTWENAEHCPGTAVDVEIRAKDSSRSVVRLTHSKLPSPEGREEMKGGWSWAMDSLRSYLETGRPIPHGEWEASR